MSVLLLTERNSQYETGENRRGIAVHMPDSYCPIVFAVPFFGGGDSSCSIVYWERREIELEILALFSEKFQTAIRILSHMEIHK